MPSSISSFGAFQRDADKREYRRHPIRLSGALILHASIKIPFEVRDCCLGGMLIVLRPDASNANKLGELNLRAAREVIASCTIGLETSRKELRFRARLAHIDGNRIGLAFQEPDPVAVHALVNHAKANTKSARNEQASGAHPKRHDHKQRSKLVGACNEAAHSVLTPLIGAFHELAAENLFEAAKSTKSTVEQNGYFEAIKLLDEGRNRLATTFIDEIARRLPSVAQRETPTFTDRPEDFPPDVLSLVENQALDHWLWAADFMDSVETKHRDLLTALSERLGLVLDASPKVRDNPYGPSLFVHAFRDTIRLLGLRHSVLQTCYLSFRKAFSKFSGGLYERLNELCIDHGLLPDLKKVVKAPKLGPSTRSTHPAPSSRNPRHATDHPSKRHDSSLADSRQPTGEYSQQEWDDLDTDLSAEKRSDPPDTEVSAPNPPRSSLDSNFRQSRKEQDVYGLIGKLWEFSQHGTQGCVQDGNPEQWLGPDSKGAVSPPAPPSEGNRYSPKELVAVLPNEITGGVNGVSLGEHIKAVLTQHAGNASKTIGTREGRIIDVADEVFGAILSDAYVASSIRPWLKQLAIPILRIALLDESLFANKTHVVREVIDKISKLDPQLDNDTGEDPAGITRALESVINRVVSDSDGTTDVFEQAAGELDRLIQLQNDVYRKNLKNVVSECLRTEAQTKASLPKVPTSRDHDSDEWVRRVRRLREGHWILFDVDGSKPKRLKIAWIAVHTGRFIFVDALGKKDRIVLEKDLAEKLHKGSALSLDGTDEPAMSRAQYSMLQKLHKQMLFESTHDSLTGLINRREFETLLGEAINEAKALHQTHALCIVDLDQFKLVNTNCGYDAGDKLLREVTRVLGEELAEDWPFARLGTDQFGILMREQSLTDALTIMENQMAALHDYRFVWNEDRISISISGGVTTLHPRTTDFRKTMQEAESSCSAAKELGGNRLQIHHGGTSRCKEAMKWAARIDKALDDDALFLRCQKIEPLSDATDEPHYELLLGLPDEFGGQNELSTFIKAAEHHKRMVEIDRWVIRKAFEWLGANEDQASDVASFSINLSGDSLGDEGLIGYIGDEARRTGITLKRICFEITETVGITDLSDAADFIKTIKTLGCRFSLDDFGSGMSSYAYLKSLPVDFLKIDGVFIEGLTRDSKDYAVVKSICEIGHFLGKAVVAEYVDNSTTLAVLREIGIDFAQGHAIEHPLKLSELLSGQ